MKYIQLIEQARTTGVANESKMNVAIAQMSCDLESVKNEKPNLFWKIMRHQHAVLYDRHYSEKFANHDVNCLEYGEPDEEGMPPCMAHIGRAYRSWKLRGISNFILR